MTGIRALAAPIEKGSDFICGVLSRVCNPAAEELGLLFRDHVSEWRRKHAQSILAKAEEKLKDRTNVFGHPRLICEAVEKGSWSDDDEVHDMWAGLLASSCTSDGKDESNLIFMSLLGQMTASEVRLLNHLAPTAPKIISFGLTLGSERIRFSDVLRIMQLPDMDRVQMEIEHLRALGIFADAAQETIAPRANVWDLRMLGLRLYVRGRGFVGSPEEFFGISSGMASGIMRFEIVPDSANFPW